MVLCWVNYLNKIRKIGILMEDTLRKIREVILETSKDHGMEIDKIILFGSRARGDEREDSDWDILIVTEGELDLRVKGDFIADVGWILVNKNIVPEILVVDRVSFQKYRNITGYVYHWAEKEGIPIT